MDPGEKTLWSDVRVGELATYQGVAYGVDSGLFGASTWAIHRMVDLNADGDALDPGEHAVFGLPERYEDRGGVPGNLAFSHDGKLYFHIWNQGVSLELRDITGNGNATDEGESRVVTMASFGAGAVATLGDDLVIRGTPFFPQFPIVSRGSGFRFPASSSPALPPIFHEHHAFSVELATNQGFERAMTSDRADTLFLGAADGAVVIAEDGNGDLDMLDDGEVRPYVALGEGVYAEALAYESGDGKLAVLEADLANGLQGVPEVVRVATDLNADGDALDDGELQLLADGFEHVGGVAPLPTVAKTPGDYNDDGVADAADYTVWRDQLGSPAGTLANDVTGVPVGSLAYEAWAVAYRGGTDAAANVPEPTALVPIGLAVMVMPPRSGARG